MEREQDRMRGGLEPPSRRLFFLSGQLRLVHSSQLTDTDAAEAAVSAVARADKCKRRLLGRP